MGEGPHAIEIDLMQPLDAEKSPKVCCRARAHASHGPRSSPLSHSQVHVPPLNHLGLWVDNIEVAVADLTAKGAEPSVQRAHQRSHLSHSQASGSLRVEFAKGPAAIRLRLFIQRATASSLCAGKVLASLRSRLSPGSSRPPRCPH
jgi:hypothetical protein